MMQDDDRDALALRALDMPPRARRSNYPEPYYSRMAGREKRQLGDHFGLKAFGVNLTTLAPGGASALMHRHSRQDEFVYILEGHPTLRTDVGEVALSPGMCAGFAAQGIAHHLVNRTAEKVVYLEVGDRCDGDGADYPEDDLQAAFDESGAWRFTRKDGSLY